MGFGWDDRDMQCAGDVGRMAALGKYDVEFNVFGCSYLKNGTQYYRATGKGEKMYDFAYEEMLSDNFPTPVEEDMYQTVVPVEMKDIIMDETKLHLIQKMKRIYHDVYRVMHPLLEKAANDSAYEGLKEEEEALDGYFDDLTLQLFQGTVELAYLAKALRREQLEEFYVWLEKERRQMEDDPIISGRFERYFYGFGYSEDGTHLQYFCDADRVEVMAQWQKRLVNGARVMPIVKKRYWFESVQVMPFLRKDFLKILEKVEDSAYFERLGVLKSGAQVISREEVKACRDLIDKDISKEACKVLDFYAALWLA